MILLNKTERSILQGDIFNIDNKELKMTINMIDLIKRKLEDKISTHYALLEVPYYLNIGDLLIWQGEKDFLSTIESKCIYTSDSTNFNYKLKLSKDVTILLQGGGNFGDIWNEPQAFRKKIISMYPDNKVIIFPQTVHYQCKENLINDANFFSKYPNVTICARDIKSYEILKMYFTRNELLLLPDMAFCIKRDFKAEEKGDKILFAKRTDIEINNSINYDIIPKDCEIHDWPTFEKNMISKELSRINHVLYFFDIIFHTSIVNKFTRYYWEYVRLPKMVDLGIKFLEPYHTIYTTRLHIGILGILMGKKVYMLDNSYGKLSCFYNTWLKDCKNVELL